MSVDQAGASLSEDLIKREMLLIFVKLNTFLCITNKTIPAQ